MPGIAEIAYPVANAKAGALSVIDAGSAFGDQDDSLIEWAREIA